MNWINVLRENSKAMKDLALLAKSENRAFTEEEQNLFNSYKEKIKEAKKAIENEKELQETEKYVENVNQDIDNIGNKTPASKITVNRNEPLWKSTGEMLNAVRLSRFGQHDKRLNVGLGGNTQDPEEGGFLVPSELSNEILKITGETSAFASRCDVKTLTKGNTYEQNRVKSEDRTEANLYGGAVVYWANEASTVNRANLKFDRLKIDTDKILGFYYASSESLEDSPLLEKEVSECIGEAFGHKIDDGIIDGGGAGQFDGILFGTQSNAHTIRVAKETNQAAGTVIYENILAMRSRMWAGFRNNAAWFINQEVEDQLMNLTKTIGTNGQLVYMPANGLRDKPYDTLLGLPVILSESCKGLGSEGDIILANMSQYAIAQKGGMKRDMSIHVQFLTDQNCYRFRTRMGGRSKWDNAITPRNGNTTYSSVVTLADRS